MFLDILKLLFGQKKLKQKDIISKAKLDRWQIEKRILEREQTIEREKIEIKNQRKENKYPYGKKMLNILSINFFLLEAGTAWVTWKSFQLAYLTGNSPDFTPLVTLISIVAAQTVSYIAYSNKAKAENIAGGIVFETAMLEAKKNEDNSDAVG